MTSQVCRWSSKRLKRTFLMKRSKLQWKTMQLNIPSKVVRLIRQLELKCVADFFALLVLRRSSGPAFGFHHVSSLERQTRCCVVPKWEMGWSASEYAIESMALDTLSNARKVSPPFVFWSSLVWRPPLRWHPCAASCPQCPLKRCPLSLLCLLRPPPQGALLLRPRPPSVPLLLFRRQSAHPPHPRHVYLRWKLCTITLGCPLPHAC